MPISNLFLHCDTGYSVLIQYSCKYCGPQWRATDSKRLEMTTISLEGKFYNFQYSHTYSFTHTNKQTKKERKKKAECQGGFSFVTVVWMWTEYGHVTEVPHRPLIDELSHVSVFRFTFTRPSHMNLNPPLCIISMRVPTHVAQQTVQAGNQ